MTNARHETGLYARQFRADQVDVGNQFIERRDFRRSETGADELAVRQRPAVGIARQAQDGAVDGRRQRPPWRR